MAKHSVGPKQQSLQREEFNSSEMGESAPPPPIVGFTTRLNLPESKRKRKRALAEPDSPRPKSEEDLREEAAWKQVEETGKPMVLDQELLLPEGMSVAQAIQFLPDGLREQTDAAWNAKLSQIWNFMFESTAQQIRKDVEGNGEWERYNSLPSYAQHAQTESIMREQWNMPKVPFEELVQQWKNPPNEEQSAPSPKKKKRQAKGTHQQRVHRESAVVETETKQEIVPSGSYMTLEKTVQPPERRVPQVHSSAPSAAALEWNREHHHFLLKRLDQILGYLDDEEQQAVQEILNRPIGKQEIDQIDEIVKGVEWVRRLQK